MPGWDSITLAVNGVYGPRYCVCLHDRDFVQALVCNHQRVIVTVRSGELINTRLESLDEENLYLRDLRVLDVDGSVEYQDGDAVAREDVKSITVGESELGAIQSLMRRDGVPPGQEPLVHGSTGVGGRPSHGVLALQRSVRV